MTPPRPGGIDWPRLISLGIGRLGLGPQAFWSLTPRELFAILGRPPSGLSRAEFDALARRFPDPPDPQTPGADAP